MLDEPTANLDQLNLEKVEAFITDYKKRRELPVVWVSHDPEQLNRISQHILYFDSYSYEISPGFGGIS